jgi:hypothetical protein
LRDENSIFFENLLCAMMKYEIDPFTLAISIFSQYCITKELQFLPKSLLNSFLAFLWFPTGKSQEVVLCIYSLV